jgi:hypothetical protein
MGGEIVVVVARAQDFLPPPTLRNTGCRLKTTLAVPKPTRRNAGRGRAPEAYPHSQRRARGLCSSRVQHQRQPHDLHHHQHAPLTLAPAHVEAESGFARTPDLEPVLEVEALCFVDRGGILFGLVLW